MRSIVAILLITSLSVSAQSGLPVTYLPGSDTTRPVIFYISGDGGWNHFSAALAQSLHDKGYTVAGLNARSYFWDKRTPAETAAAIGAYINTVIRPHTGQAIVFVGYSFGADVVPFFTGQLPAGIREKVHAVVLLSPSTSTDFEIHVSELMGWGRKRNMDVVAAINAMTGMKISAIFGDDETEFPVNSVHNRNFNYRRLPGGHHYDGDINMVVAAVIAGF